MKITTFLSVNNENLGAIARMSNGTFCIVYKGAQVAPKQGFQKYVWVTIVLRSTLELILWGGFNIEYWIVRKKTFSTGKPLPLIQEGQL